MEFQCFGSCAGGKAGLASHALYLFRILARRTGANVAMTPGCFCFLAAWPAWRARFSCFAVSACRALSLSAALARELLLMMRRCPRASKRADGLDELGTTRRPRRLHEQNSGIESETGRDRGLGWGCACQKRVVGAPMARLALAPSSTCGVGDAAGRAVPVSESAQTRWRARQAHNAPASSTVIQKNRSRRWTVLHGTRRQRRFCTGARAVDVPKERRDVEAGPARLHGATYPLSTDARNCAARDV